MSNGMCKRETNAERSQWKGKANGAKILSFFMNQNGKENEQRALCELTDSKTVLDDSILSFPLDFNESEIW